MTQPSPEEVAAVVAVLRAVAARRRAAATEPAPTSTWNDRAPLRRGAPRMGMGLPPSPTAWRTSYWPR
jgi:hypothetical protein